MLLEFDEETVDDFIRENIVVFDERVGILRYLSYQPACIPPKIEDAKGEAVSGGGCFFEHNGYKYGLGKNDLTSWGAMGKYHVNRQNSRRKIIYNIWAIRRQIGVVQNGFVTYERTEDLLKKTSINGKPFWDIYDTEYDDGEVLRGYY